ncbi:MAG: phosphoribosyl-ATP diphosphatase [Parvibaculaceae bacterium]|nr:phosphoribosyl-ATP diphosphatase [Parvibaculaceae bacterium]
MKPTANQLDDLFDVIKSRKGQDPSSSYTARLFAKGTEKCAQKLGEEAVELVIAATTNNRTELVTESADLLYHWLVLLAERDIAPQDVYAELARREGVSGLDEKAARPKDV